MCKQGVGGPGLALEGSLSRVPTMRSRGWFSKFFPIEFSPGGQRLIHFNEKGRIGAGL